MATMARGGFSKLLTPGYRKIVFNSMKDRPVEGTKLVNQNTADRAYIEDVNMAGFGPLLPKPEGGPIVYQRIQEGNVKRYVWSTFAGAYRITEEMYEDELYGIFGNKLSAALGRSARLNEEVLMHDPYNNAFSTSYNGFVSGEALCGNHTSLRGVVQRNRPAVDSDITLPALQAALEHFHNLKSEEGFPELRIPKLLVHSVSDHWTVSQLLKSSQLPGTNLNDINQVANEGLTAHLSHYIVDTDAWFIIGDVHDVNYFERKPFTFSNSDDFETGDARFKGTRRAGSGWGDWRGIYGSSGA